MPAQADAVEFQARPRKVIRAKVEEIGVRGELGDGKGRRGDFEHHAYQHLFPREVRANRVGNRGAGINGERMTGFNSAWVDAHLQQYRTGE
jgi:hypothetical protein